MRRLVGANTNKADEDQRVQISGSEPEQPIAEIVMTRRSWLEGWTHGLSLGRAESRVERITTMAQLLQGLTPLSTQVLEKLLKHLYRQDISCPLTSEGLALIRLQYCQEPILAALRSLDAKAITAVLVCVIAERRNSARATEPQPEPSDSLISF